MKMNQIPNLHKQQGFSLFMVMIIMVVIALLVVVTNQMTSTETRLGANEADRKFALSAAEGGLRTGEKELSTWLRDLKASKSGTPVEKTFRANCRDGLCAPSETVTWVNKDKSPFKIDDADNGSESTPAWERDNTLTGNNSLPGETANVRYIIEYLGEKKASGSSDTKDYFRITSRAKGENANTVVTLQSYVEMTRD